MLPQISMSSKLLYLDTKKSIEKSATKDYIKNRIIEIKLA